MDFSLLVKDIPKDDLELFLKKTDSTLTAKKSINKIAIDYGWVDVLDESIPYLDNLTHIYLSLSIVPLIILDF